mmetsp:Transcript_26104/g.48655  ORF Transcript_26104/g.48655 Transcript_26104/m.48655 type:complete len:400 (-) Transcript_26104:176-1375(-)
MIGGAARSSLANGLFRVASRISSREASTTGRAIHSRPSAASVPMAIGLVGTSLAGAAVFNYLVLGTSDPSRRKAVSACDSLRSLDDYNFPDKSSESHRFQQCLAYHRSLLRSYHSRWDWANAQSRLPTTSWPLNVPSDEDVGALMVDLRFCARSPNFRSDKDYCDRLRFRVGSYLLMQPDTATQKRGLKIVRDLAERGYADGMCSYATCLNDGRAGLDPNPKQAVVWWRLCADMHSHPQSMYELGVALYTGEGCSEDETQAVRLWRSSANLGHPGAAYMLGDCLLDGVGIERDRAEALEWLITAAELGHRGARSRVLAVLDKDDDEDYGRFTDASRQTLKENVYQVEEKVANSGEARDEKEGGFDHQVSIERRYTIGGGSRNPVVLARRKTIVQESRED